MPKKSFINEADLTEVEATAPLWMVSFADLSLLLLTFFILMLAFSNQQEVHDEDLLRILASIRASFGYTPERDQTAQFDETVLQILARQDLGRQRRNKMRWTSPAIEGQLGRPKDVYVTARSAVGRPILFEPGSARIEQEWRNVVDELAAIVRNHYRELIIEGYASADEAETERDRSDLAYRRALAVKLALAEEEGVGPERIRLMVAPTGDPTQEAEGALQRRAVVVLGSYYLPGGKDVFARKPASVPRPIHIPGL
ncbi:MAG: OmpA family protein [Planctomycetes bacterium]|nr:OmpA family protein [Planctomycetota bacterium]